MNYIYYYIQFILYYTRIICKYIFQSTSLSSFVNINLLVYFIHLYLFVLHFLIFIVNFSTLYNFKEKNISNKYEILHFFPLFLFHYSFSNANLYFSQEKQIYTSV